MREIKFRGKRVDNGEWVYGWYVRDQIVVSVDEMSASKNKMWIRSMEDYNVDPATVAQSTFRKDCKGVDIYGGDIEKSGMTGAIYVICWSDENAGWYKEQIGANRADRPISQDSTSSRVIGNIHDNPELIK